MRQRAMKRGFGLHMVSILFQNAKFLDNQGIQTVICIYNFYYSSVVHRSLVEFGLFFKIRTFICYHNFFTKHRLKVDLQLSCIAISRCWSKHQMFPSNISFLLRFGLADRQLRNRERPATGILSHQKPPSSMNNSSLKLPHMKSALTYHYSKAIQWVCALLEG